ncbi:GAF domain-containing sensor histidine kinase [Fulvivirga sp. 29W222]|uniref:histidine kinase n=1 Tax=Fulvivirga marina TaxID=2494733 RepID=A0A937G214_9BACT|nr:GAF domain-containing sensor histidine kinase [Fulvivirga marina]MBL6448598.1 GAF domain-containing sensor histidine kinase [Fulvivirga marina]
MDSSKTEKEQLLALTNNLKSIQRLTTTHFTDFKELISSYLKVGLQIFNMKIGIVSKINDAEYLVCNCISQIQQIESGTIFPLEGTYCREVVKTNSVIGLPHVGLLKEMKTHPVYINMKLESYISAPIYVDEVLFGTLNFSSTQPRKYGFSEHERDLIAMMANAIGAFLMLEKKEKDLYNSNDRMKRLVGYVAHDLRAPLSNIKTLTSFIDSNEYADIIEMIRASSARALEFVHTILETAAMGSGKIKLNMASHDFSALFKERCEYYKSFKNDKELNWELEVEEGITLEADKDRMLQVFDNLLSNCTKYTPYGGQVTATLKSLNNSHVKVELSNTVDELVSSNGFDIKHKVGFGQEIINEILKLHHSDGLKLHVKDNTYHACFELK